MTKRIISLLLSLILVTAVASADSLFGSLDLSNLFGTGSSGDLELTKTHIYGDHFVINYPSTWDVSGDSSKDTENYRYGGLLFSPEDTGLNVDIHLYYNDGWEGFSLIDQDMETIQAFDALTAESAADLKYVMREYIYTPTQGIPFIIYDAEDQYGPMYSAETIIDGWFVTIYGFAYDDGTFTDCRELTDEDYALFIDVVNTYTPIP